LKYHFRKLELKEDLSPKAADFSPASIIDKLILHRKGSNLTWIFDVVDSLYLLHLSMLTQFILAISFIKGLVIGSSRHTSNIDRAHSATHSHIVKADFFILTSMQLPCF